MAGTTGRMGHRPRTPPRDKRHGSRSTHQKLQHGNHRRRRRTHVRTLDWQGQDQVPRLLLQHPPPRSLEGQRTPPRHRRALRLLPDQRRLLRTRLRRIPARRRPHRQQSHLLRRKYRPLRLLRRTAHLPVGRAGRSVLACLPTPQRPCRPPVGPERHLPERLPDHHFRHVSHLP